MAETRASSERILRADSEERYLDVLLLPEDAGVDDIRSRQAELVHRFRAEPHVLAAVNHAAEAAVGVCNSRVDVPGIVFRLKRAWCPQWGVPAEDTAEFLGDRFHLDKLIEHRAVSIHRSTGKCGTELTQAVLHSALVFLEEEEPKLRDDMADWYCNTAFEERERIFEKLKPGVSSGAESVRALSEAVTEMEGRVHVRIGQGLRLSPDRAEIVRFHSVVGEEITELKYRHMLLKLQQVSRKHDESEANCKRSDGASGRQWNLGSATAWCRKGDGFHLRGQDEDALYCYDSALELDPRYAGAWLSKGVTLGSLGRDEDAVRCYDRALELYPQYAMAWYGRAVSQDRLGRWSDARRSYRQYITFAPAGYSKHVDYAKRRVQELEGRQEEVAPATSHRRGTVRIVESVSGAPEWKGEVDVLVAQGKCDEALRRCAERLRQNPGDAWAWFGKAEALDRLGRNNEAVKAYREVVVYAAFRDERLIERAERRICELEGG